MDDLCIPTRILSTSIRTAAGRIHKFRLMMAWAIPNECDYSFPSSVRVTQTTRVMYIIGTQYTDTL